MELIKKTIDLSKQAVANGNHPFAALLVVDNEIILEALNTVNTENDSNCHAELNLVSLANRKFGSEKLKKAILYSSTEPCAMCSGAIYWSGIRKVVYGCSTEKLAEITGGGLVISSKKLFSYGSELVETIGPILEEDAAEVHKNFW